MTSSISKTILLSFFILHAAFLLNCKEKTELPPKEIIEQYQKNAHIFCNAVVECFKEDALLRLKNHPERAKLIAEKMDMELCFENQYNLIGQSSAQIYLNKPSLNLEYYKSYENCALKVSSKQNCTERFDTYKNDSDCKTIKERS